MEMPRPLMVFTLKLYPFHISHFLECEMKPLILIFQLKLAETLVNCEMEMKAASSHFTQNLETDLDSTLCWPYPVELHI